AGQLEAVFALRLRLGADDRVLHRMDSAQRELQDLREERRMPIQHLWILGSLQFSRDETAVGEVQDRGCPRLGGGSGGCQAEPDNALKAKLDCAVENDSRAHA